MSLAHDLLALARKMANYKKTDLRAARLRRTVSTVYYALFHLLVEEAAGQFVTDPQLRILVGRAFAHSEMQKVGRSFMSGGGSLPSQVATILSGTLPAEIQRIANVFVDLQEARHEGDYDPTRVFTRAEVQRLVARAEQAFADWTAVKGLPTARVACEVFLASLLLGERWRR